MITRKPWLVSVTYQDTSYEQVVSVLETGLSWETQERLAQSLGTEAISKMYDIPIKLITNVKALQLSKE